jgi:hypothetical protein
MLNTHLSCVASIVLRCVPSNPRFFKSFIMKGCWIWSKAFSVSLQIIKWHFSFSLFMWYIILINLHGLNHLCNPGMKATWSWCITCIGTTRVWTQGLSLARQILYHLSHSTCPVWSLKCVIEFDLSVFD